MVKKTLQIATFLGLGILGGLLWQIAVLPYLAEETVFSNWWFVREFKERKIIMYPKERTVITENESLERAVEKAEKSVVLIETETKTGAILRGNGVIVATDGLILTLAELVPNGAVFSFRMNGEKFEGEIIKKDLSNNLALLKASRSGFSPVNFSDLSKARKGQAVFLTGYETNGKNQLAIFNSGFIRSFGDQYVATNIKEEKTLAGSGLFDVDGSLLGMNVIGLDNEVLSIPSSSFRSFLGI